ncbi:uncharacterized protein [Periplaneta americana]|uniref:uncharacterized protein n=1 Tax=Periplaneta americana TaxID=6978 RepID=UPI0037E7A58A
MFGHRAIKDAYCVVVLFIALVGSAVCVPHHGHRTRGLRHMQHKEEIAETDYDLEEDMEMTAQEELKSLSSWLVEHDSDDIAIWRPNGGAHPLCPPPSLHHIDPTLCDEPVCQQDSDCVLDPGTEGSGAGENETNTDACCYNGCIHTCTKKLEPPIAYDWLEEFRANEGRENEMVGVREGASSLPLQLHARILPEMIALPGGCVLTANQYKELEGFRKSVHVNRCFCDKGGVSCEVSQINLTQR